MKYILILVPFLLFVNCIQTKHLTKSGKVIIQKQNTNDGSTLIDGSINELINNNPIKHSDIWIEDKRYDCDSFGQFKIQIKPGKYRIDARGLFFKSYPYKLTIKKGEAINLKFYLASDPLY